MFNLHRKQIKPKVYWIQFTVNKDYKGYNTIRSGYSLEEVKDEIEKENGSVSIVDYLEQDLEELLNKYSEEKILLDNLKK